ncbi:SUMO-conjugating enzyme SCE1-like [Panicum miliaceum]|uniref:SUMO-conjugating enzyme SCE1-like n=1 Tax=Panicum miliaceum TaxID=4540 RepID=A0A3L6PSQ3_PANMI|nr:SUMO-conjugating enzyme SCE1-like [Panicum miliaceum]
MASGGVASCRLAEERKSHPQGFVARPEKLPNGSVNLLLWNCVIPGKQGAWNPSITVQQILVCIQGLLDDPNPASPAQRYIYHLFAKVFDIQLGMKYSS